MAERSGDGTPADGESLAGKLLVASPLIVDPNFARSVVLLLAHDGEGAMGLVLNRPSEAAAGEHVPQWAARVTVPPVLFVGGPVERRAVIGLETSDEPVEPTSLPGVGLASLAESGGPPLRVFAGYAGWGPGQLEGELDEGAWVVSEARADDVVTGTPERLWATALRRLGGPYRLLAVYPPDPALN